MLPAHTVFGFFVIGCSKFPQEWDATDQLEEKRTEMGQNNKAGHNCGQNREFSCAINRADQVAVRQDLRREMEEFAAKERRRLGNVGELLLEWAFEQLKIAGSVDRLLKYQLGKREEKRQQK